MNTVVMQRICCRLSSFDNLLQINCRRRFCGFVVQLVVRYTANTPQIEVCGVLA